MENTLNVFIIQVRNEAMHFNEMGHKCTSLDFLLKMHLRTGTCNRNDVAMALGIDFRNVTKQSHND